MRFSKGQSNFLNVLHDKIMIEQFYDITSKLHLEQFSRPRTITLIQYYKNVVEGRRWSSVIKMDFYFMYNRLLSVTFSSTHTRTKSATQFVITITYIYKSQFGKTSLLKLWLSFFCQGLFEKAKPQKSNSNPKLQSKDKQAAGRCSLLHTSKQ